MYKIGYVLKSDVIRIFNGSWWVKIVIVLFICLVFCFNWKFWKVGVFEYMYNFNYFLKLFINKYVINLIFVKDF